MLDWTADVVGRMHQAKIKGSELAREAGLSATYLSTVLNGHKGDDHTKANVIGALERLEKSRGIKR